MSSESNKRIDRTFSATGVSGAVAPMVIVAAFGNAARAFGSYDPLFYYRPVQNRAGAVGFADIPKTGNQSAVAERIRRLGGLHASEPSYLVRDSGGGGNPTMVMAGDPAKR